MKFVVGQTVRLNNFNTTTLLKQFKDRYNITKNSLFSVTEVNVNFTNDVPVYRVKHREDCFFLIFENEIEAVDLKIGDEVRLSSAGLDAFNNFNKDNVFEICDTFPNYGYSIQLNKFSAQGQSLSNGITKLIVLPYEIELILSLVNFIDQKIKQLDEKFKNRLRKKMEERR